MPLNTEEVINVCTQLAAQENLKVCVTESAKGACIAGTCALAGGVFGGPLGLAVGGVLGSLGAAWKAKGKYKSVVEVILCDMTNAQREQLYLSVKRVLEEIDVQDFVTLAALVATNRSIEQLVLTTLGGFLKDQMGLAIAS